MFKCQRAWEKRNAAALLNCFDGNLGTSRRRGQSRDFTPTFFPVHCKSKFHPHVPWMQPLLGRPVALFSHPSILRPELMWSQDGYGSAAPGYSQATTSRTRKPFPTGASIPIPFISSHSPQPSISLLCLTWVKKAGVPPYSSVKIEKSKQA